jgi:hypothetical protein
MSRQALENIGLTGEEAAARLARNGYNEWPSARPRSLLGIPWVGVSM